jgi:hypothetical protein
VWCCAVSRRWPSRTRRAAARFRRLLRRQGLDGLATRSAFSLNPYLLIEPPHWPDLTPHESARYCPALAVRPPPFQRHRLPDRGRVHWSKGSRSASAKRHRPVSQPATSSCRARPPRANASAWASHQPPASPSASCAFTANSKTRHQPRIRCTHPPSPPLSDFSPRQRHFVIAVALAARQVPPAAASGLSSQSMMPFCNGEVIISSSQWITLVRSRAESHP